MGSLLSPSKLHRDTAPLPWLTRQTDRLPLVEKPLNCPSAAALTSDDMIRGRMSALRLSMIPLRLGRPLQGLRLLIMPRRETNGKSSSPSPAQAGGAAQGSDKLLGWTGEPLPELSHDLEPCLPRPAAGRRPRPGRLPAAARQCRLQSRHGL